MCKIKHEIFGDLEYNYGWVKDVQLNIFGVSRVFELIIDGEKDGKFEQLQEQAYINFFKDSERIMSDIEQAIYKYYNDIFIQYRERLDEKLSDVMVSRITKINELSKLVAPKQLIFPIPHNEAVMTVGMLFDCKWEPEHGLAVKLENGKITEVGFQDIVL